MKAVILAGGLGTRISEETDRRPKPMVEIGGRPILWHIMKLYSSYNINDFIICCGYKGYVIKEYFANYFLHMSDVTFDMEKNTMEVHHKSAEPWKVTLIDTGEDTLTGGRLKRVERYLQNEEHFCFTYGDGVADIDLNALIRFHLGHKKMATLTSVIPPGRYGAIKVRDNMVERFTEKPNGDGGMISGGFFVVSKECLSLLGGDNCNWEQDVLVSLAASENLMSYEHRGFWHAMDTLRDKNHLESLWSTGNAPWKSNW